MNRMTVTLKSTVSEALIHGTTSAALKPEMVRSSPLGPHMHSECSVVNEVGQA